MFILELFPVHKSKFDMFPKPSAPSKKTLVTPKYVAGKNCLISSRPQNEKPENERLQTSDCPHKNTQQLGMGSPIWWQHGKFTNSSVFVKQCCFETCGSFQCGMQASPHRDLCAHIRASMTALHGTFSRTRSPDCQLVSTRAWPDVSIPT